MVPCLLGDRAGRLIPSTHETDAKAADGWLEYRATVPAVAMPLCAAVRVDSMIKVYDASNITEAHIVRGMLEANGITAHVGGYYLQGGIGDLAVQGFVSVMVDSEYALSARALIDDYEKGGS